MEFQRDINRLEVPRFNASRFYPRRFGLSYLDFLELPASVFCSFITELAPMHVSLRGKENFLLFCNHHMAPEDFILASQNLFIFTSCLHVLVKLYISAFPYLHIWGQCGPSWRVFLSPYRPLNPHGSR